MVKKHGKRVVSVLFTLALVIGLIAGLTTSAAAVDNWDGSSSSTSWTGSGTSGSPYIIDTGAELKGFANNVNAGTTYSGVYFRLDDDINLGNYNWVPIGGQSTEDGNFIPNNGKLFAGTFEGNGKTISGLNLTATLTTSNFAGWGLFGNSSGTIKNLTVNGGITLGRASGSVTPEYIGPVVGYLSGSVFNCDTTVTIDVTGGSNVGGVVGAIESTSVSAVNPPLKIQYCSASGSITAAKRLGGIVGGVYCKFAGNAIVDNCKYINGTLTSTNTSSKAYGGGIVGYSRGYISNSYANNITLASSGGHYLAGVAGILQGASPMAGLYNCYANVVSYSGCDTNYDRPLYGSVDFSNVLPIVGCIWTEIGSYNQPDPFFNANWGKSFNGTQEVNVTDLNDSATVNILLNSFGQFAQGGSGHPVLVSESAGSLDFSYVPNYAAYATTPTNYDSTDNPTALYLDVTGATGGAYTDLTTAVNNLSANGQVIYVKATIPISTNTTLPVNSNGYNYVLKRSSTFPGAMFNVTGGTLTLGGNVTLDGNDYRWGSVSPVGALILVGQNGAASIQGATLQNNKSGDGAGVWILGGNLTMSSGTITGCEAVGNGGAVSVNAGGSFNMTAGTITGNTATKGPGVYLSIGDFAVAPTGSGFNLVDVVYLEDGKSINVNATLSGITGSLTVECANPTSGTVVASCSSTGIATTSLSKFAYVGGAHSFTRVGSQIRIS